MSNIPLPCKVIKGVYQGYIPIGLPQHRPPNRIKPWMKYKGKPYLTLYPKQEIEGYSEVAEYPALNDASIPGLKSQVRYDWYDKLKNVPTADGKMYEMVRHSNHYIGHMHNYINNYNALPFVQYLTHTRLINELPQNYQNSTDTELIGEIKNIVLDQVAIDKYQSIKSQPRFVAKTYSSQASRSRVENQMVQNIYSCIKRRLAIEKNPQLLEYQHDLEPALRSWWYHSGFEPPNNKVFWKSRKDSLGKINQIIQMDGESALNLRSDSFIEPILSFDDTLVTEPAIEEYSYPLKEYGLKFKFAHPVALTGNWFHENSQYDFPHTTFLNTNCSDMRYKISYKVVKPLSDRENALNSQAILTAFGWLNSLAMYHGFTPFHEIEYPFTCQVITTDGKDWLFNVYQLNSHSFHRDLKGPRRNNICWSSGLMQLYKDFDGSKFHDVNEDVIKILVGLLSQQTNSQYTKALNLRPYITDDIRTEEEVANERKVLRKAIEQRKNKFILHDWQVPLWEKIFFHWKPARGSIKHMKPRYHIPKPKYPEIFE